MLTIAKHLEWWTFLQTNVSFSQIWTIFMPGVMAAKYNGLSDVNWSVSPRKGCLFFLTLSSMTTFQKQTFEFCHLGLVTGNKLPWNAHVDKISSKENKFVSLILKKDLQKSEWRCHCKNSVALPPGMVPTWVLSYRVTRNFCGSLFLRIGNFLWFAGTEFCDYDRLVFLAGN